MSTGSTPPPSPPEQDAERSREPKPFFLPLDWMYDPDRVPEVSWSRKVDEEVRRLLEQDPLRPPRTTRSSPSSPMR